MLLPTRTSLAPLLLALLAASGLAPDARAQGVRIVDTSGDRNYATIGAAVKEATAGDVLLIGAGEYAGFTVDKPLTLLAAPAGANVRVLGSVRILDVVGGRVALRGIEVAPPLRLQDVPILIEGCEDVRLTSCVAIAAMSFSEYWGYHAIHVDMTDRFVLESCTATASQPDENTAPYEDGGTGGAGLYLRMSSAAVYASTLTGGAGGFGDERGGNGGCGIDAFDSTVFLSGSTLIGGPGGSGLFSSGGTGGAGLRGNSSSIARSLDSALSGGSGGPNGGTSGAGVNFGGVYTTIPGIARTYTAPAFVSSGSAFSVMATGEPRDRVTVLWAPRTSLEYAPGLAGVWLIPRLRFLPLHIMPTTVPPNGIVSFDIEAPPLPPAEAGRSLYGQGLSISRPFLPRLANAIDPYVLQHDAGPDCNGNGIQDYIEIIDGSAADANTDLIPDDCQYTGPVWYVDEIAAAGGDGSPNAPFRSIALAILQASPTHSILVADGIYRGANNRNLGATGLAGVTLRSMNGPAACIIDCEGLGRGFELINNEGPLSVVEGFTIRSGDADMGTPGVETGRGGGILLGGNSMSLKSAATVVNCIIEDCQGAFGSAMYFGTYGLRGTLRDSVVRHNGSMPLTLPAVYMTRGGTVVNSSIENNVSPGIYTHGGPTQRHSRILNCTIQGNTGGGIQVYGSARFTDIAGCMIVNNSTPTDGGGIFIGGHPTVSISNCTVAGNQAVGLAGGIYSREYSFPDERVVTVDNTIFWDNTSGSGNPIVFEFYGTALLRFEACDIQGGQASISQFVTGPLDYVGNIDSDPLFLDAIGYRLGVGSPCIDAANYTLLLNDPADIDQDGLAGEKTPQDIDGELRTIDDLAVPDTGSGSVPYLDIGADERQP